MLQGQRDLLAVGRLILSELAPGRLGAAGRLLHAGRLGRRAARSSCSRATPARARRPGRRRFGWARGWSGSARSRSRRSCWISVPRATTSRSRPGLGKRHAAQHHRPAGPLRGRGQGRARAGVLRALQPGAPGAPRPADGVDRHRAQHDRGQHADRRPADAVAVARRRAAVPAGGAAPDQPAARGEGRAAGRAQRRGRAQEPGGRAGPARAGGEGAPAGADVQVQVGVPGQHVARAADAAQQPADPVRPALAQPRRQPDAQADRVRQDDPRLRQGPAGADQRHPGPVEDRVRHGRGRRRGAAAGASCSTTSSGRSATSRRPRSSTSQIDTDALAAARRSSPTRSGCSRSSRTCCRTPSSSPSGAASSLRVETATEGWSPDARVPQPGRARSSRSRSPTPASAFPATSSRSSSRRSSRPTAAPAASTAAPGSAWPSAARSRACSAARSASRARPARAARSRSSFPRSTPAPRSAAAAGARDAVPHRLGDVATWTRCIRRRPRSSPSTRSRTTAAPSDPEDRVLLIVENDENFARFLVDLAHENGFKALVATKGADAMALVQSAPRIDAITLDIQLPVMDGWRLLERFKGDLATRHIPVYVITTEDDTARAFPLGAIGVAAEADQDPRDAGPRLRRDPAHRWNGPSRDLLLICPDSERRARIVGALGNGDLRHRSLAALPEGLSARSAQDCLRLRRARRRLARFASIWTPSRRSSVSARTRRIPVVLSYSEVGLARGRAASSSTGSAAPRGVKPVRSLDRLVDQALALPPPSGQPAVAGAAASASSACTRPTRSWPGKKVLIVDDDIRNIFAMTSVLERQHMRRHLGRDRQGGHRQARRARRASTSS